MIECAKIAKNNVRKSKKKENFVLCNLRMISKLQGFRASGLQGFDRGSQLFFACDRRQQSPFPFFPIALVKIFLRRGLPQSIPVFPQPSPVFPQPGLELMSPHKKFHDTALIKYMGSVRSEKKLISLLLPIIVRKGEGNLGGKRGA